MPLDEHRANVIARVVPKVVLYFPKKFTAYAFGELYKLAHYLQHPEIACAQCQQNIPVPQPSAQQVQYLFESLENHWIWLHLKLLQGTVSLMEMIIPQVLQNRFAQLFNRIYAASEQPLSHFGQWLSVHEKQIIYQGLLPGIFLGLCVWLWGMAIIPEIYTFLIASIVAGKVLNHAANLVARRAQSEEWQFIRASYRLLTWQMTLVAYQQRYGQNSRRYLRDLTLELGLVVLWGQVGNFVKYSTQAFFSWLALYVLVKLTADETPDMMIALEGYMQADQQHTSQHRLPVQNAAWLLLYQTCRSFSTDKTLHEYQQRHQQFRHSQRI